MVRGIITIGVLVIAGAILADLIAPNHVKGTQSLVNGLTGLWESAVKGASGAYAPQ